MGLILDMLSPTVYKFSVFLFTPGNLGAKPLKWLMTWIYMKMQNLWKFPYAQSIQNKGYKRRWTGPDAWDNFLQWWCHQNFFLLLMLISTTVIVSTRNSIKGWTNQYGNNYYYKGNKNYSEIFFYF